MLAGAGAAGAAVLASAGTGLSSGEWAAQAVTAASAATNDSNLMIRNLRRNDEGAHHNAAPGRARTAHRKSRPRRAALLASSAGTHGSSHSGAELAHQLAPVARRHHGALAAVGAEVEKTDDDIARLEAEPGLHLRVVGGAARLPHGGEAERGARQHDGVGGGARRQGLFDL